MAVASSLGAMLRTRRLGVGLSQQELARRAGVSVRTLRDIELGHLRQPHPESLRRLAAAVGLDLDGLELEGTDPARTKRSHRPGPGDLELGVLGPLWVRWGGRVVVIGSVKQRLLLGVLALHPDQVVGREELVEVLWGAQPPRSSHSLIHTYVARLRRLLERPAAGRHAGRLAGGRGRVAGVGGVIVAVGGGYRLMADRVRLDLLRFDALLAAAQRLQASEPGAALELLAEALGCWRGRVLADLPGVLDQHPVVAALTQRRTAAVLAYADVALELGQAQQAAMQLGRLAHDEPLHEGLHARLMLALATCGQQAAALEMFGRLRGRLAGELGVEPGRELQEAQARVLRGDLPHPRPTPATAPHPAAQEPPARGHASAGQAAIVADRWPVPAQLPADVAGFTGRRSDLEQLDGLLSLSGGDAASGPPEPPGPVVVAVIAGMAGVGKTALAVHWAHRVAGRLPDGQLYVDLRGYAEVPPLDAMQALAVLLAGLGVPAQRIPAEPDAAGALYRSLLAGRQVLVVLDNARDAAQVRPLLPGSPGCLVLVTSRDRLTGLVATHGARRLDLEVLAHQEATVLLGRLLGADRAAAEPDAVDELVRRCARLPLALRIAAANLASQPDQTIADYLAELQHGNGEGDRLAGLAAEGDPHTAVQVAFDHSYQHLPADCRRLFRLLGLAPGPQVSVPAAAALAEVSPQQARRLLGRLSNAHLVEPRGPGRVGLHDLLRAYARQRTDQADAPTERTTALKRLYAWYLHATDTAAKTLYPEELRLSFPPADAPPVAFADAAAAMAWLEAERANLVAAIQDASEHGLHQAAWLLADALRGYFARRQHTIEWLSVARASVTAARSAGDIRAQAASQLGLAQAHLATDRYTHTIRHYTRALTLARHAGWVDGQAEALSKLGIASIWSGRPEQAVDHHTEALRLYRRTGLVSGQATALHGLGVANRLLGRLQVAVEHHSQALRLYRQVGSRPGEAYALGNLAETYHDLGRLADAHQHLTRALTFLDGLGSQLGRAFVSYSLAAVHRDAGRHAQALDEAQAALRLTCETGHRAVEAEVRNTLASTHLRLGHYQQAHDHYQHALELARQTDTRIPETSALLGLAAVAQHTGHPLRAVDHAQQARTLAAEAGLTPLEGQSHAELAAAHHALGRHQQARKHAEQALRLYRRTGHRLGQARSLHLLAHILADIGDPRSAAACRQQALELSAEAGSPDPETAQPREPLDT